MALEDRFFLKINEGYNELIVYKFYNKVCIIIW